MAGEVGGLCVCWVCIVCYVLFVLSVFCVSVCVCVYVGRLEVQFIFAAFYVCVKLEASSSENEEGGGKQVGEWEMLEGALEEEGGVSWPGNFLAALRGHLTWTTGPQ